MYYIGIGASAGGQDALCEFFDHLPPDTDAAYFVITHLLRTRRSYLDEILQRHSRMPVQRVSRRMDIQAGVVYVQPEDAVLLFDMGHVLVQKRESVEMINRSINLSLESLALNYGPEVVGIILSGTGDDGTIGIQKIAAIGGKVLVQDPDTTVFTGMPVSAIVNDHPLAVCRPADLAWKIVELLAHPISEIH